jgi:hypothetical protein
MPFNRLGMLRSLKQSKRTPLNISLHIIGIDIGTHRVRCTHRNTFGIAQMSDEYYVLALVGCNAVRSVGKAVQL